MSDDAMVPIAAILGRGEALTVAAMLDAAGIIVHVGGEHYTSLASHIVAIGGFKLTVPRWQHADAAAVIAAMLAEPPPPFSHHTRRALGRLLAAMLVPVMIYALPVVTIIGAGGILQLLVSYTLVVAAAPASPQGRGDYYLTAAST